MNAKIGLLVVAVLLAGATAPSYADDRTTGGLIGAVAGTAIGNSMGGNRGAVIGAVLGAAAGVAIASHDNDDDRRVSYDNRNRYDRPANHRGYYDDRRNVRYVPVQRYTTYHRPAPQRQVVYVNHHDHRDNGRRNDRRH